MTSLLAVIEREMKIKINSPPAFIIPLLIPLFFLLLYGVAMNSAVPPFSYRGELIGYLTFVIAGIVVMSSSSLSLTSGGALFAERQSGMLDELLACPIRRAYLVFGKILTNVILVFFQTMIILSLGSLITGQQFVSDFWGILATFLVVFLISLGFGSLSVIVAWKIRAIQTFSLSIVLLNMPLVFTSSAFYPIESMVEWQRLLAQVNPLTFGIDIIRSTTLNLSSQTSPFVEGAYLAMFVVLAQLYATYLFRKALK